jgi:hypothetical protein
MSAPVNGRLVVVGAAAGGVGLASLGVPVTGSALGGVFELPAMVGGFDGCTLQLVPLIEPQLVAAPAVAGTAHINESAKPDPINIRLAHILVALLPTGGCAWVPLTNHVNRCRRLAVASHHGGHLAPFATNPGCFSPSITQ